MSDALVRLDDVSFSYGPQRPVLKQCSHGFVGQSALWTVEFLARFANEVMCEEGDGKRVRTIYRTEQIVLIPFPARRRKSAVWPSGYSPFVGWFSSARFSQFGPVERLGACLCRSGTCLRAGHAQADRRQAQTRVQAVQGRSACCHRDSDGGMTGVWRRCGEAERQWPWSAECR